MRERRIDIEIEIHLHGISQNAAETNGEQLPHLPALMSKPEERDADTDVHTWQRPQPKTGLRVFLERADLGPVDFLERMLRAEQYLRNDRHKQYRNHIPVLENIERNVRFFHCLEPIQDEGEQNERKGENPAQQRRREPHEVVAIDHEAARHEHKQAYEQAAGYVDAAQRHTLRHRTPRTAQHKLAKHHITHRAYGKHMHHLPCEMESDHSRKPRTARDGGQQHNVQHREEHAEVARRRNPQLNVGHALERALYLGYAGYEADRQQYRHVGRAHGYEVAHGYHHSRADKQKAVGEAEFHAEEHRKPHRHARKSGIKQHQQVFNHQIRVPRTASNAPR